MSLAKDESGSEPIPAPRELELRGIRGDQSQVWRAVFDGDILSLVSPEDRTVLMLPREDAVRHMRFRWDVFRGATVAFEVLQGLKAHTFRCTPAQRDQFLAWLPQKSAAERAREVRLHAAVLILFGMFQLFFHAQLYPVWGAVLQALALVAMLRPARGMHGLLGLGMLLAGLAMLFSPQVLVLADGAGSLTRLLGTVSGSVLLLWGVQQFSLLGVHYQLRPPEHPEAVDAPLRSRLVFRVALCAIASAIACVAYAVGLYFVARQSAAPLDDVLIFALLSLLSALAAAVLLIRRRPPYLEARITGQMLIIVAVLYVSGVAAGLASGQSLALTRDILATGILRFDRPYVWAPLILLLILFQRWFLARVENEVEEGRNG